MLLDAHAAGQGAAFLHQSKYSYTESWTAPAAISVDEVLADPDLMAASQRAQVAIDTELGKLQAELGLADDEILEMPFLYTEFQYGNQRFQIAYQPGTVNALVMQDTIVIPKPFGPVIDGEDLFEADLRARLGGGQNELGSDGLGLDVFFADDWDLYHRLDGEVHCGTNPEGPIPASGLQWWETGR